LLGRLRSGGLWFLAILGKKVHETPSQQKVWWCMPVIPVMAGNVNRRIMLQVTLNKKQDLISKK
jgi:hypothetical protein